MGVAVGAAVDPEGEIVTKHQFSLERAAWRERVQRSLAHARELGLQCWTGSTPARCDECGGSIGLLSPCQVTVDQATGDSITRCVLCLDKQQPPLVRVSYHLQCDKWHADGYGGADRDLVTLAEYPTLRQAWEALQTRAQQPGAGLGKLELARWCHWPVDAAEQGLLAHGSGTEIWRGWGEAGSLPGWEEIERRNREKL